MLAVIVAVDVVVKGKVVFFKSVCSLLKEKIPVIYNVISNFEPFQCLFAQPQHLPLELPEVCRRRQLLPRLLFRFLHYNFQLHWPLAGLLGVMVPGLLVVVRVVVLVVIGKTEVVEQEQAPVGPCTLHRLAAAAVVNNLPLRLIDILCRCFLVVRSLVEHNLQH